MKSVPKVGQKLFGVIRDYNRNSTPQTKILTVIKVGRKYFEVMPDGSNYGLSVHHIDANWREKTKYTPYITLYESEQAYKDELRANQICETLKGAFEHGGNHLKISLDELEAINKIILGIDK